jgi:hypothetical protein
MGGRHLTVLPGWSDCRRCDRWQHRLGVVAPVWPDKVRVVVMSVWAPRASQLTTRLDPELERVVQVVRHRLGLGEEECVADSLLACGLRQRGTADQVAACSGRYAEQQVQPTVVALLDRTALQSAWTAGLVSEDGSRWTPVGSTGAAVVLLEDLEFGLRSIATTLGLSLRPAPVENRQALVAKAADLLAAVPAHQGIRLKIGTETKTRNGTLLSKDLAERHLRGELFVSPFHPQGAWPYVVLDIDRHNAMQDREFDNTMKSIRKVFPKSLYMQSSESRGVHVYVRVPDGWEYAHAALVLRVYLTLQRVRWHRVTEDGKRIATDLVEVPAEPTRLSLGHGSFILGSTDPLEQQLDTFITFITAPPADEFERARETVLKRWNFTTLTLPGRKKLERWLMDQETGHLRKVQPKPGDPWARLAGRVGARGRGFKLSPAVWKVAMNGVPSYGSRIRWTQALIKELRNLVEPEVADELMMAWLARPGHNSADIESDIGSVAAEIQKTVGDEYKKAAGVPVRIWKKVLPTLGQSYKNLWLPPVVDRPTRNIEKRNEYIEVKKTLKMEDVLATAFFILRGFFKSKRRARRVSSREFGVFCGKNKSAKMRSLLLSSHWLLQLEPGVPGVKSGLYTLHPSLWPARPAEPRLFVPPSGPRPRA